MKNTELSQIALTQDATGAIANQFIYQQHISTSFTSTLIIQELKPNTFSF